MSQTFPENHNPASYKKDAMSYLYIFATIIFTVYGQLILKFEISKMGIFPSGIMAKADFLLHCFKNLWILSGFVAAFFASLTWMAAMTHFELSFAYPFTILSFVAIQAFSILFFGEMLTISKIAGTLLIAAGIFALTR